MALITKSATQLRSLLEARQTTSVEIVQACLDQIADVDERVGAFVTVTGATALQGARESDLRRQQGRPLSPWDGIPVAIKDNISTEGIRTTCGSRMLDTYVPPYDATVVRKLKRAGLPLLGKTNMDEFAMGSSTEHSAMFPTKNPWDSTRVPGGSSGGSAAAVASFQAPWSLGSDTGGSIRQPASFCGVVGVKPTYGAVSRYGLVAYASSLDQIGTFGRNVEDAASLLQLIMEHDPQDSTSLSVPESAPGLCLSHELAGLRVGLPQEYYGEGLDEQVRSSVEASIHQLERAGAKITEVSLPMTKYAIATYYLIATAEASSNLARYDGVRYGLRVEAPNSVAMFEQTRAQGFGMEVQRRIMLGTYALSAGYYDAYYKKAQQVRTLMRGEFASVLQDVDVLITPTTPTTAFPMGATGDPLAMYLQDIYTVTANLVGVPALSLPCGTDRAGLPIGLQIIGDHMQESQLWRIARELERLLVKGSEG